MNRTNSTINILKLKALPLYRIMETSENCGKYKGGLIMGIKTVDLIKMAEEPNVRRKVLMNGPRFHTWLHVYATPGDIDEMHCHNADQTFYCVEGECTMFFPDGGNTVLKPGMIALIPGGKFYQLKNTGSGKMVMIGARALSNEASLKIDYETRKDINEGRQKGDPPKATQILV